MGIYSSGSINFSQLGSETDFKQLIDDLSKIETKYANKLLKWRADWKERMEGFSTVRSELQNLRNSIASLNTVDKFMAKSAASSNDKVAVAKASSEAKPGSYNVSVKQLATRASWSINTGFANKSDMVNSTASTTTFEYEYKGETRTLTVPPYTTLEGLQRLINGDSANPGVTASLVESSTGIYFQLSGNETGADATLAITDTGALDSVFTPDPQPRWIPGTNGFSLRKGFGSGDDVINTTPDTKVFTFERNGTEYQFSVPSGATIEDLANIINQTSGTTKVEAKLVPGYGGRIDFVLERTDSAGTFAIVDDPSWDTLPALSVSNVVANWDIQENQNAMVRINGVPAPPHWLQKDSNTITDLVDGLEINIRAVGDTTLTVELDKASLKENIEKFVEAVNKFRTILKELTDVDTSKTVAKPEIAESQFEMQMGGVLTGNYGVQTVGTKIKQALANSPSGFLHKDALGPGIGDMFSSLSQIGITTCAAEGDPNFGLLVINTEKGKNGSLSLDEAIEKDATAVAELFAANSQGKSHSTFFTHASHVPGQTQPGTYKVEFITQDDGSGNMVTTGTINGAALKYYAADNTWGVADPSNPANGITIQITDFAPGQQREGYLSIRDGMVNTLLNMFDGPEGMLSKEKGPLTILENNYKNIIKNIDDKLIKEDDRLARWQRTMQLRFSRLETTLGTYNKMNEAVKSMIQQLGQSSSSS